MTRTAFLDEMCNDILVFLNKHVLALTLHFHESRPTLGNPVVEGLSVVTSGASTAQFNPSKKLTLHAEWHSTDPSTAIKWSSDDVSLVYGETTSTLTTTSYLVVLAESSLDGSNIFVGGNSYTFRFEATNRYGRYDWGELTVVAGRPPSGGNFSASPKNGTTMSTRFSLRTKNWINDAGKKV